MARRATEETRVRQRLLQVFGRTGLGPPGPGPLPSNGDDPEPGTALPGLRRPPSPGGAGAPSLGGSGPIPPAAAFDPGRPGLRALALVAVLVLGGAAVLAWQARPRSDPVDRASISAAPSEAAGESATGVLVVAVTGHVRRPGLVRLPAGSRVADAIEAAGGALPGTDLSLVNLARKVSDGELIAIGITPPAGAALGEQPASGKVNLNTATLAELDTLPGVGPVLAQRILDHRQRHGGFRAVTELRQVDGIGDARYEQLKELVTV